MAGERLAAGQAARTSLGLRSLTGTKATAPPSRTASRSWLMSLISGPGWILGTALDDLLNHQESSDQLQVDEFTGGYVAHRTASSR
jgi:hypothetical protein